MKSQGAFATYTGDSAEKNIICRLHEKRIEFKRHYPICTSVYGYGIETDFYLKNLDDFPLGLCLESKWQDSKGSVDEKFPYQVWQHPRGFHDDRFDICMIMDNNLLAAPKKWTEEIFKWFIDSGVKMDCCQGFDARLLTEKWAGRLREVKHKVGLRFAWDNIGEEAAVVQGITPPSSKISIGATGSESSG